ncbi:TPA: cyclase family protein [Methanosarcinaceae archaeon]|nr:cyclase family protein [Methanosarcinaceae archaeon]
MLNVPAPGKVIDITVPISPSTRVFPGDPEPSIKSVYTLEADGCAVSRLSFGSHTGTHVDAPSHILKDGKPVDNLELGGLMGRALILDFSSKTGALSVDILESVFRNTSSPEGITVLLLKTKSPGFRTGAGSDLNDTDARQAEDSGNRKNGEKEENGELDESVYLEESAAAWIVNNGFTTVGIDSFSVDSLASENLPAHHILLSSRVNIVECLDLSPVEAGNYFFICLPLKIVDCDGAPARAVLLQE